MPEHTTTRLVQHKVPQHLILSNKSGLRPQSIARRWRHPTDEHIAHLTLGMATYGMNNFAGSHVNPLIMNAKHISQLTFIQAYRQSVWSVLVDVI